MYSQHSKWLSLSLLCLSPPPHPDTLALVCIVFQIKFLQSKPSPTTARNNLVSSCISCASNYHHTLTWLWFASFYNSNQSHHYHQICMARQAHNLVSGCISCASNHHHAQTPLPWLSQPHVQRQPPNQLDSPPFSILTPIINSHPHFSFYPLSSASVTHPN